MEALLKNLKEHVTCSICLDTYTEPKTIDCLHTFCCECLEKHALTSQTQGSYRCPECQAQVGVPEGNRFDRLPSSFLHNSLLSLLAVRRSLDGSEIGCSFCQKKSAEINYCFDCEKFLCPDCLKAHDVFRTAAFEGHKFTSVRQFQPEDYEALLKRQSFCPQQYHEREVTRFFCLQCQICVCHVCIVTDHKSHNAVPIEKAADDEKANIIAEAELIKEKIQACSDLIHQFETTEAELETSITIAKRQVSETAEQMAAKVREYEREAITLLEETRVLRIEKLHSAKELVRSLEKQRKQAVEFANNLIRGSSSSDIMQSKKNLKQRFKKLAKVQVPPLPVSSFVKFVPRCAADSLKLGFITFGITDADRSTVEGLSQNFQAGKVAELSICPKTSEGEVTNNEQDQVEVLVEPADQVATLTICKQQDGKVQVKFVANVPQTYNVTAKINGESLANSPFSIRVHERKFDFVGEFKLNSGKVSPKPRGIAANSKGLIAVAERQLHSIVILDKEGKHLRNVGCYGNNAGQLINPADVTFLNDDEILVADQQNHRITQFNVQSGAFVKSFGKKGTGDGEFRNPISVCMDNKGHVVVTEFANNRIQVLTKDGEPVFKFGDRAPTLSRPLGCVCHKNMFIVSDSNNHCLKVYDDSGRFTHNIGEEGEADGQLNRPFGLCVDKYDNVLVCDRDNNRIQQFGIRGRFIGKHVVNEPWGITLTPDGYILISESASNKLFIMK